MKIKNKFLIAFSILAFCIGIGGIISLHYQKRLIKGFADKHTENAKDYVFSHFKNNKIHLEGLLKLIAKNDKIKKLFMQKDRNYLYSYCYPIFLDLTDNMEVSHFYFIDTNGRCFLRVHGKDLYGDLIKRQTFITARDENKISSGIELGKTAFALRAVMPYYNGTELIGYIELAVDLDIIIKSITNNKYKFDLFADKKYMDKNDWKSLRKIKGLNDNWNNFNDYIEILSSNETKNSFFNEQNAAEIAKGQLFSTIEKEEGRVFSLGGFEILGSTGKHSGIILSIIDITTEANIIKENNRILFPLMFFLVVITLLISIKLARSFTLPVLKLTELVKNFANNSNKNIVFDVKSDDEFDLLAKSFNNMVKEISTHKQREDILLRKEIKRTKEIKKAYNDIKDKEDELNVINFELTALNKEYIETTKELKIIKSGLEKEVQERTTELENINFDLEIQVAKRTKDLNDSEIHLKQSLLRVRKILECIINVISVTVERRDPYTAGHQRRVSSLARAIAEEMGLKKDMIEGIRLAGLVHDLGKIAIPAEILSKPGNIDKAEFALIKRHSEIGYEILKDIDFPWPIAQIAYQHHERINGTGYPLGLKGDEMLLESKILAVADVVEAISSHRPYRPALGIDIALKEITDKKGILFDNKVVEACVKVIKDKTFKFSD